MYCPKCGTVVFESRIVERQTGFQFAAEGGVDSVSVVALYLCDACGAYCAKSHNIRFDAQGIGRQVDAEDQVAK